LEFPFADDGNGLTLGQRDMEGLASHPCWMVASEIRSGSLFGSLEPY